MLERLRRLPGRIRQDLKIIRLAENWPELLKKKAAQQPYTNIRLRNGVRLSSPPQVSLDFLFHEIWIDEFYAPMGYQLSHGDSVVDIGGNIGVFALYAATRAKNINVFSYEPFPKNAEYFRKNVGDSNSSNVSFSEKAVSNTSTTRSLHVDDSWILHALADERTGPGSIEVQCTTLDEILGDLEVCDLLKIDCEGGEYDVFYGASDKSMEKIRKIVCEFNEVNSTDRNGVALKDHLQRKGYTIDEFKMLEPGSGFLCARR